MSSYGFEWIYLHTDLIARMLTDFTDFLFFLMMGILLGKGITLTLGYACVSLICTDSTDFLTAPCVR